MQKLKRSRMLNFLVTEDELETVKMRAKSRNITVSEYIRKCALKEDSTVDTDQVMLEEIRNSICQTEDICRQLNQDSVFLQRIGMLLMRLNRFMISKYSDTWPYSLLCPTLGGRKTIIAQTPEKVK